MGPLVNLRYENAKLLCFQTGTASDEKLCSKGHMCDTGAASQTPCEPGTFQDNEGMSECLVCQVRFFVMTS